MIRAGRPDSSKLIRRVSGRSDDSMPPLATEVVDADGVALLRRWISAMD